METAHVHRTPDGARLAYRRWRCPAPAEHLPLVLIHGAASNLTRWSEFVAETSLKSARDILRLDLRGHGGSVHRGPTGLEIWCDDIAAVLRKEGIVRAVLVGHCLGANVAVAFAARYLDLAGGLVLVEPMLRAALTGKMRRVRWLVPALRVAIGGIRLLNRAGIHRRALESLDLQALDREFRARLAEPGGREALEKRYASLRGDLRIMPTAGFLRDLVETVRPLQLERVRAPVLALLSSGRTFADADRTRDGLTPLADAEICMVESAHWIPTEQPQAMRIAIEDWLKRRGL
jgi:pimeloyl-ACP methyl ester carboxylesterase